MGISCHYHDAAAALIRDGTLIAAAEEERFTRVKHDDNFPIQAIEFCLREGKIVADDLDYLVFYEKPFLKFERIFSSAAHTAPFSWRMFQASMLPWLTEKLWVKGLIRDRLRLRDSERILFSEHHLSHAASAYYCSPYSEAAVLTADGVGEWATTTLGVGNGNKLKILYELKFPHSIGLLYSAFTSFLGFQVNDGEYKVMGMGAYGEPRYMDKVYKLIETGADGSISLNMKYFSYHRSLGPMFNRRFEDLFGPPRTKEQAEYLDQYYADIAASIQKVTEDILVGMAKYLKQLTGMRYLCMAGGVALNSLANYRILREAGFDEIYIQPAASDAGGALGAALWANHMVLGQPRNFTMTHAYYGESQQPAEISNYLSQNNIAFEEFDDQDRLVGRVVDALLKGKVAGWYQGKTEWGAPSLGEQVYRGQPLFGRDERPGKQ